MVQELKRFKSVLCSELKEAHSSEDSENLQEFKQHVQEAWRDTSLIFEDYSGEQHGTTIKDLYGRINVLYNVLCIREFENI